MKYTSEGIRTMANGKYKGWLAYKDENGKWKQKSKTLKATGKRAADKELKEWHAEMEAEAEAEALAAAGGANPSETVADYVAQYIEGRSTHVESSSKRGYRGLLRKEIAPYIGSIPLDDLTPDDVDKWLSDLSKDYEPVTCKKAFVLLRSAMTQAVERDRLAKNPTRTVRPPKVEQGNPNALTEHDLGMVLSMLDIDNLTPAMLAAKMAICTGMRQGELLGLQWKNVDIDNGVIYVDEAIGQGENGLYTKNPKNKNSKRPVVYVPIIGQDLSNRRAEMEKECLAAGVLFSDDMYVLGNVDGSYMQPHYVSTKWRGFADAFNLIGTEGNRVTFRDLRHSYASTAIHNGIDPKVVADSMGHANPYMTLKTYTSADNDAQRRAAEKLNEIYGTLAERSKRGANIIDVTGSEG